MARNPIHDKKLFEVIGRGTPDAAEKWDATMRELYREHGITSQADLARVTGISATTLQSNGAWKTPHTMSYRTFVVVCRELGVDCVDVWNRYDGYIPELSQRFEEAYEDTKDRVGELVSGFLRLNPDVQHAILAMLEGVSKDEFTAGDDLQFAVCSMLGEQMADVIERCHSWDYIDLS